MCVHACTYGIDTRRYTLVLLVLEYLYSSSCTAVEKYAWYVQLYTAVYTAVLQLYYSCTTAAVYSGSTAVVLYGGNRK